MSTTSSDLSVITLPVKSSSIIRSSPRSSQALVVSSSSLLIQYTNADLLGSFVPLNCGITFMIRALGGRC